jgi:hypothetical protein
MGMSLALTLLTSDRPLEDARKKQQSLTDARLSGKGEQQGTSIAGATRVHLASGGFISTRAGSRISLFSRSDSSPLTSSSNS